MDFKKIQIANIAINIIITAIMIYFFSAGLRCQSQNTQKNDAGAPNPTVSLAGETKKEIPVLPKPEDLAAATNSFEIQIGSGGYSTKGIAANMKISKTLLLKIKNNDSKPHSFVIDDLKINSGAIAAGTEKNLSIDNISNTTRTYEYYSDQKGDDRNSFRGSLLVIKE